MKSILKSPLFKSILLIALFAYISGLFVGIVSDAGIYATISREILKSGEWIKLTCRGELYLQKPPFHFWLSAISFMFFGISNFAYKLPTLLLSFAGAYFTFRLGKLLYGKTVGHIAWIVLMFSEVMFLYNMDVHTDTIFTVNIIFTIWQLALYIRNKKIINIALGSLGASLAMLTKGPVGLAVPVFAIISHLLLRRDFKILFRRQWLLAPVIIAICIFPYLYGLYSSFGIKGPLFYFWTNNVGRITGSYDGDNSDYSFYLHTLIYLIIPWTIPMFIALFMEFKEKIGSLMSGNTKHEYYCIGGITIFSVILSVSVQKAPHYIFPIIPLIAILTGKWIEKILLLKQYPRLEKWILRLQPYVLSFVWILIFTIPIYIFPSDNMLLWCVIALLFILFIWILIKHKGLIQLFTASMLTIASFSLMINTYMFPSMLEYQTAIKAANVYNAMAGENEQLYNYEYNYTELSFYTKELPRKVKSKEELHHVLKKDNIWIFTTDKGLEDIRKAGIEPKQLFQWRHKHLSQPDIKFYVPKTRESTLKNTYLIQL